jgi:hypothetical protein
MNKQPGSYFRELRDKIFRLKYLNSLMPQTGGKLLGSIVDPGSGAFLTPGSGMGKKSGSGSGMNNPDHISQSLETKFFGLK